MPSLAEMETDAKHLDYGIWMFMETSECFLRQRELPTDDVLRRALFESCLLHFRALLEFFRADKKYGDDLRAADYIHDPLHKTAIGNLAPNATELDRAQKLHKAIAHIVSGRDRLNTNWSAADLSMVTSRLKVFFAHLAAPRHRWFPRSSSWFAQWLPEMTTPGSA